MEGVVVIDAGETRGNISDYFEKPAVEKAKVEEDETTFFGNGYGDGTE